MKILFEVRNTRQHDVIVMGWDIFPLGKSYGARATYKFVFQSLSAHENEESHLVHDHGVIDSSRADSV